MEFNSTTDKDGLIQDIETLLGMDDGHISGNATRLKQFTRMINIWYKRAVSWIWEATGTWEYDDSNKTTLPIATTDLVDDQQDYELPSIAQKVDRVEVMDDSGDYQLLIPIDKSQITDEALSEYYETNGMPVVYDLVGRSIILYPTPATADVTLVAGLKVYVSRDVDVFTSADTTKEPGFVDNFHTICSVGAALRYAIGESLSDKKRDLKADLKDLKSELQAFYGSRHRDMPSRILPKTRSHI